jgi:hypothetical protein
MIEAVQTNASPTAIWVTCAVVVACLAFWLIAVAVASRDTKAGQPRATTMTRSVTGGTHLDEGDRGAAPERNEPVRGDDGDPGIPPSGAVRIIDGQAESYGLPPDR